MKLQGRARRGRTFKTAASAAPAGTPYDLTDAVYEQLLTLAPGWDRQALVARYREWSRGKEAPDNPHGAFLGWVKGFTKKKAAALGFRRGMRHGSTATPKGGGAVAASRRKNRPRPPGQGPVRRRRPAIGDGA